jgi:hypothetical protein
VAPGSRAKNGREPAWGVLSEESSDEVERKHGAIGLTQWCRRAVRCYWAMDMK